MSTKEKVLSVISALDDDVSIDEVIDRLYLLQKVEAGVRQADRGDLMDHDTFMEQLTHWN